MKPLEIIVKLCTQVCIVSKCAHLCIYICRIYIWTLVRLFQTVSMVFFSGDVLKTLFGVILTLCNISGNIDI